MTTLDAQVGELRGDISGLNRRIDDLHCLLIVLMGIAGTGVLVTEARLVLHLMG